MIIAVLVVLVLTLTIVAKVGFALIVGMNGNDSIQARCHTGFVIGQSRYHHLDVLEWIAKQHARDYVF